MVNGRVYHFTCLPFGLATSPREFTKLLWPVVQLLRLQGIKLHVYLNDWLIPSSSVVQARTHADLVLQVLQHLGWVINFSKSNLVPSQQFYSYRHAVQHMRLHRGTSTQNAGQNPEHPGSVEITPAHIYQGSVQTLGMLTFKATLVPRGRVRLRPIQWWASEVLCQKTGSWSDRISVTPTILHQVAWCCRGFHWVP